MTPEQRKKLEAFFDLPYETQIELTGMPKGTLASHKHRYNAPGLSETVAEKLIKSYEEYGKAK